MSGDSLGDRMKRYEDVSRTMLTSRTPMIIRVDGRAFHTFTRAFRTRDAIDPWSPDLHQALTAAASALLLDVAGAKLAYAQSDEISVLVTDYDALGTQPWFDKVAQKVASVSASIATALFNDSIGWSRATFDGRCFVLPKEEVCNYFIWRQQDATRNSVSMLAQHHFSHKRLQGLNSSQMQELLHSEKNVNWDKTDTWKKRGWCVLRSTEEGVVIEGTPDDEAAVFGKTYMRTVIKPDLEIPIFTKDREYIDRYVFLEEVGGA